MSTLFPERFETERLELEYISHETVDLFELYNIRGDTEEMGPVTEYLPWNAHQSPKETADLIDRAEKEWRDGTTARYVIRLDPSESKSGSLIGYTKLAVDWERSTATLGIWLRNQYWGEGYATERAHALIEIAFDRLSLDLVAITHHVDNERSRRAVEKYVSRFGGTHEGCLRNWQVTNDGPVDVERYTISADEYERACSD
ncbi:GNAT family N-acetyltransferase [Halostagnicola larsenii]|uniref:GNAT family N-acetyltransferase n=1 Tax=Halostagnicola larsenii TaxID=353800 RepID=UPI000A064ED6|nr:GNAT family protein [Halostagnicola larsenii]